MLRTLRSVLRRSAFTAALALAAMQPGWAGTQENVATVRDYFAAISGKDKPAATLNVYVSDEEQKNTSPSSSQPFRAMF